MRKKNKATLELNKNRIKKKRKLPYIIGLIVVGIVILFSVNYYISQNYVYNIPFTNLNINGNNPIINANSNNVGDVYYIQNNKLVKVSNNDKIEALKNAVTANCTREYISFANGYPRLVRNYIVYPFNQSIESNETSDENSSGSTSDIYSIQGNVNNNSFQGEIINMDSQTGTGEIEYTISKKVNGDAYINVYITKGGVNMTPSNSKDENASFTIDLSQGKHSISYNFETLGNAEDILNNIYDYALYGEINN